MEGQRPDQKLWVEAMRGQGYLASVVHGWDAARGVIEWYLEGGTNGHKEERKWEGRVDTITNNGDSR